ncbi:MAG: hypothetical protein IKX47_02815 [Oscillospiraceae bacterium]|nr:hypothetical protein [Oscillospiraceae bacterium]
MKVLFIGNSHTFFNDMPLTFARLWEAGTGERISPVLLCHPGMGFDYHVKEYFESRFNLLFGGFDYCILQQKAHPFSDTREDLAAGKRLAELAKAGNVKPVFALTWAEKAYPEHQEQMNVFHEELCRETGALLSPVGRIWQDLLRQDPDFPLYWQDGEHASVYGDYLIACTHYRLLSGKSCNGLPSMGCDFSDPEKKAIREDPASPMRPLDPDLCAAIRSAVDRAFRD